MVLWEPTRNGGVVGSVRSLAEPDANGVAVEIEADGGSGGRTILLFYGDSPSSEVTGGGFAFRGRYATVVEEDGSSTVCMYDATRFQGAGFDITVRRRPPLPAAEVIRLDEDRWGVALDGCWDDITAEAPRLFDRAEHVILDQDGTRRAFPVTSVVVRNARTVLVCGRDPGFDYDASARVLRERFSPFNTVTGEALLELPSRVGVVQTDGRMEVMASDSVTVNGTTMGRTDGWMSISRQD